MVLHQIIFGKMIAKVGHLLHLKVKVKSIDTLWSNQNFNLYPAECSYCAFGMFAQNLHTVFQVTSQNMHSFLGRWNCW